MIIIKKKLASIIMNCYTSLSKCRAFRFHMDSSIVQTTVWTPYVRIPNVIYLRTIQV